METVQPILKAWNQDWFCVSSNTVGVLQGKEPQVAPATSYAYSRRAEEIKMALTSALKDFIASGFASIAEVERVYTLRHPSEEVVYVRVVLPQSDRALRDRVYSKEKEIIDAFDVLDFDFGIVSSPDSVDPSLELVYKKM